MRTHSTIKSKIQQFIFAMPLGAGMARKVGLRRASFIATVFASLCLVLLPFEPVSRNTVSVAITALGEKDPSAKSSEVWLVSPDAASIDRRGDSDGWESKAGMLGSFSTQPATLRFNVDAISTPVLALATHEFAGMAAIQIDDERFVVNLYSRIAGAREIALSDYSHATVDHLATAIRFVALFFAVFTILLWLILLLTRQVGSTPPPERVTAWWALFYAVPSVVVYGVVHLAFWPGQMSPDSLDQWWQVTHGSLSDAHPLLSTALYLGARTIVASPALAVSIQYVLFALATGLFLLEARRWGARAHALAVVAILFPLLPPNFFIATTLWKDVPYATALVMLAYGAARTIRKDFQLGKWDYAALAGIGIVALGVRHNGVLVSIPFFVLLMFVAPRRAKPDFLALVVLQCAAFLLLKTVLLSAFHVKPLAKEYRAIVGMHVIGAMAVRDVSMAGDERALIARIMPVETWKSSYRCDSVVPMFWNSALSRKELRKETGAINRLALRLAAAHPLIYMHHQLCVTRLIWRISPVQGEWLPISTLEITDVEQARMLGLRMDSRLVPLRDQLGVVHAELGKSAWWNRPALYLLLGTLIAVTLSLTVSVYSWLILAPGLLNAGSLFFLMGAQDYRYLWPSIVVAILLMCLGVLVPKAPLAIRADR